MSGRGGPQRVRVAGVPGTGQELDRARTGQNLQNLNEKWEGKWGPLNTFQKPGVGVGETPDGGLLCLPTSCLVSVEDQSHLRAEGSRKQSATLFPFQKLGWG